MCSHRHYNVGNSGIVISDYNLFFQGFSTHSQCDDSEYTTRFHWWHCHIVDPLHRYLSTTTFTNKQIIGAVSLTKAVVFVLFHYTIFCINNSPCCATVSNHWIASNFPRRIPTSTQLTLRVGFHHPVPSSSPIGLMSSACAHGPTWKYGNSNTVLHQQKATSTSSKCILQRETISFDISVTEI